jgi:DNA-binding SARP family transcriptional activator
MSLITLNVLGTPTVSYGGQRLSFRNRKALALLIYLAVERGAHLRDHLAALCWPEVDQAHSRMLLRSAIAWLRQALAAAGADPAAALIVEQDQLQLNRAVLDLDLAALDAAERSVQAAAPAEQIDLRATLLAALKAYRGDFLLGFSVSDAPSFDEWVSIERERRHRQMHPLFEQLTQLLCADGAWDAAIDVATRWVAHDPLHEVAHRRLMQAHADAGNRTAALQAFQHCAAVLEAELGVPPSPETTALADDIRARDRRLALGVRQAPEAERDMLSLRVVRPATLMQGWSDLRQPLARAYHLARHGQAQILVLEGSTRRGENDLAADVAGWATAQGADLLYGRAYDLGGRIPYQPLADALRLRIDQERAPDDLLPDVWLTELSRLLPDLRDRYPDLPPPLVDDATGPMRLYEALVRLTAALAQRRPLVWMVDDVQWADVASLDLLHYAAQRWVADAVPILLLCTVRPEVSNAAVRGEWAIADWLRPLARELPVTCLAQSVPLSALRRQGLAALAA